MGHGSGQRLPFRKVAGALLETRGVEVLQEELEAEHEATVSKLKLRPPAPDPDRAPPTQATWDTAPARFSWNSLPEPELHICFETQRYDFFPPLLALVPSGVWGHFLSIPKSYKVLCGPSCLTLGHPAQCGTGMWGDLAFSSGPRPSHLRP